MRAAVALVVAGCSFQSVAATSSDAQRAADASHGSGTHHDAGLDAAPDAPPDASSACVQHATATFSGHHYFATSNASWTAAEAACEGFGGHLVKIETQGEDDFVTATFASNAYTWIGLHDPTGTNIYLWADLTPLLGYANFTNTLPPISTNDCIDSNGSWDAYGCSQSNHGGTCECE